MTAAYFWHKKSVVVVSEKVSAQEYPIVLLGALCVDTSHPLINPGMRYGKFLHGGWKQIPFDAFPPEFKAWLLLMNIQ